MTDDHQNEIRQHVKADLDDPKRIEKRQIVDNCLELLRQKFMCDMDATPYLLKYDKKAVRGDVPDMDTLHKCRDYGKLRTLVQESGHTRFVGLGSRNSVSDLAVCRDECSW